MFLIDDPTAVALLPTPEAAGTPGYFFDGDPVNNKVATRVRASFLNMLMMEIANVCTAGGVALNKSAYNQLLTAIKNLSGTPPIWGKTSTGTAVNQILTPTAPVAQLTAGLQINFIAGFQNTGPVTLNVSGLGAVPVKKVGTYGQMSLEGGEWQVNDLCTVVYDGSVFQWVDAVAYRQNGIGVTQSLGGWPTTDLNARATSGLYSVAPGSPNLPISDYGWLKVMPTADPNYLHQEFYALGSDRMFARRKTGGSWNGWREIPTQDWVNANFATIAAVNNAVNIGNTAQNTANDAWNRAVNAQNTFPSYLPNLTDGNSGQRGSIVPINTNFSYMDLPAGGVWFFMFSQYDGGGRVNAFTAGYASGGSNMNPGSQQRFGFAIRMY